MEADNIFDHLPLGGSHPDTGQFLTTIVDGINHHVPGFRHVMADRLQRQNLTELTPVPHHSRHRTPSPSKSMPRFAGKKQEGLPTITELSPEVTSAMVGGNFGIKLRLRFQDIAEECHRAAASELNVPEYRRGEFLSRELLLRAAGSEKHLSGALAYRRLSTVENEAKFYHSDDFNTQMAAERIEFIFSRPALKELRKLMAQSLTVIGQRQ